MKRLNIALLVCFLTFGFSSSAFSSVQNSNGKYKPKKERPKKVVGTPLDGGLLTILGAAGVSYFLIRRKKKNVAEA